MSEAEKQCPGCQGRGKCSKCDGSGHVMQSLPQPKSVISGAITSDSPAASRRMCPRCYGSGTCQVCKGTGKLA
jgi:hypothetical protein